MFQQIVRLDVGLSHVPNEETYRRKRCSSAGTSELSHVDERCRIRALFMLRGIAWEGDGADAALSPVCGKTTRSMSDSSIASKAARGVYAIYEAKATMPRNLCD